jgi:catechol-2,3-dioxygenase
MNHILVRAGMRVPDLAASVDHAIAALGVELVSTGESEARLALPGQAPCLVLVQADAPAFDYMLLHTSEANLATIQERALEQGLSVSDSPETDGRGIRLCAPNGVAVDVGIGSEQPRNETVRDAGPTIGSLDHLSFAAEDVDAFVTFFRSVLGFRLSDSVNDERHWLRCGPNHHTVAVFVGQNGLHHYAFETDDIRGLAELGDVLAARGQNFIWGPGRHALGANIFSYHLDPAGAILEVTSNMLQIDNDEEYEYKVWTDGLKSAVLWGPMAPAGFRELSTPSNTTQLAE